MIRFLAVAVLGAGALVMPAAAVPVGCGRAPTSAAAMNAATVQGVGYSDSFRTAALPDGRWMSVTGDTVRPGEVLPAYDNSLIIWDRAGQRRVGSSTTGSDFFPRWADGSEFWPGQWISVGTTVYVVGSRQLVRAAFDWTTLGAYIAVVTVPSCGTPRFGRYLSTPSSGLGDTAVQWSGGLARDGGWFYLHGVLDRPDVFHARDGGYIARAQRLDGTWQFWTGTGWGSTAVSTIPTVPGSCRGTESAYTVHKAALWTIVTKCNGGLADTLGTYTSSSPVGPWTWTPLLTVCAFDCYLTGAALVPTRSGRLMVEWSRSGAMPGWAEV